MTGFDFPRKARILTTREYKSIFSNANIKLVDKYCLLLAHRKPTNQARIGIVVAKKNVPLAVDRNRIKRLVRESFRHHQQCLVNMDLVIIVKPKLKKLSNHQLSQIIARKWQTLAARSGNKNTFSNH